MSMTKEQQKEQQLHNYTKVISAEAVAKYKSSLLKSLEEETHNLIDKQDRALFEHLNGKATELQHEIEKREYAISFIKGEEKS